MSKFSLKTKTKLYLKKTEKEEKTKTHKGKRLTAFTFGTIAAICLTTPLITTTVFAAGNSKISNSYSAAPVISMGDFSNRDSYGAGIGIVSEDISINDILMDNVSYSRTLGVVNANNIDTKTVPVTSEDLKNENAKTDAVATDADYYSQEDTFNYNDVTGLGHHYGDWTDKTSYVRAVIIPFWTDRSGKITAANTWHDKAAYKYLDNSKNILIANIKLNNTKYDKIEIDPSQNYNSGQYYMYYKGISESMQGTEPAISVTNPTTYADYAIDDVGGKMSYRVVNEYLQAGITKGDVTSAEEVWGAKFSEEDNTWTNTE